MVFQYNQWWASYYYKVTELLYFRYWLKKLVTFNPLPILACNGSVTVTSYCYFKCNEIITAVHLSEKKKIKALFSCKSTDVTISEEMYKAHVT
jgi:hypothetical protein